MATDIRYYKMVLLKHYGIKMFNSQTSIADDLNARVYKYPVPSSIAGVHEDQDVKEYIRNCYQRQLVLDVIGNLKINNNFNEKQLSSLEQNITTPHGIDLLVNHILFSLVNATPGK